MWLQYLTKSPFDFADFNLGHEPLPATARTLQQVLLCAAAIAEIQNLFTSKRKNSRLAEQLVGCWCPQWWDQNWWSQVLMDTRNGHATWFVMMFCIVCGQHMLRSTVDTDASISIPYTTDHNHSNINGSVSTNHLTLDSIVCMFLSAPAVSALYWLWRGPWFGVLSQHGHTARFWWQILGDEAFSNQGAFVKFAHFCSCIKVGKFLFFKQFAVVVVATEINRELADFGPS